MGQVEYLGKRRGAVCTIPPLKAYTGPLTDVARITGGGKSAVEFGPLAHVVGGERYR